MAAPLFSLAKTVVAVVGWWLLLTAPKQDWGWDVAWFTVASAVAACLVPCSVYLSRYNPDLVAERDRFTRNEGCTSFDKLIVPLLVALIAARYVAAGAQHDPATAAPLLSSPAMAAAALLHVAACAMQAWSVASNHFFSSVVRIQKDRGHKVCSRGPYAVVRHPGYVAFILQGAAEAVLLQSPVGVALAWAAAALLVVRTKAEDDFLRANLPGYAAYAQRVRSRLVPGVW